jgi:hypothetical protein
MEDLENIYYSNKHCFIASFTEVEDAFDYLNQLYADQVTDGGMVLTEGSLVRIGNVYRASMTLESAQREMYLEVVDEG